MKIIALGHKARQGKTTAAQFIARSLPGRGMIWGFSDNLKTVARVTEGMTEKDAPLLQRVGLAYRQDDPDVWIKAWTATIDDQQPLDWVIVPDLRYRNEARYLHARGAILIKVVRLLHGRPFIAEDRPADHISEVDLDNWDEWDLVIEAFDVIQLKAHLAVALLVGPIALEAALPRPAGSGGSPETA